MFFFPKFAFPKGCIKFFGSSVLKGCIKFFGSTFLKGRLNPYFHQ